MNKIIEKTEGYSAADLSALVKEAAMGPLRQLKPDQMLNVQAN